MELKEKVKNLPMTSGVYLMKDSEGSIIYVGKSKHLKSRVGSYYQNFKSHSTKVLKLVKNIKDLEYIVTDTEFEAFLLECKLIKELKPYYNKKMKSPLSYSFIQIEMGKKHPSIKSATSSRKDDGSLYFGPITSKTTVERAIEGIKECCRINCSNPTKRNSTCINYSLGLCIGICMDENMEMYQSILSKIIGLLRGTDVTILKEMEDRMKNSSIAFDFETAAKYRDYIDAVNSIISKEKVIQFTEENKNIIMVEKLSDNNAKYFFIKGNKVIFTKLYNLEDIDTYTLINTLKEDILNHFSAEGVPYSIHVTKDDVDEAQIVYSYLKNNNCKFVIIPIEWLDSRDVSSIIKALDKIL